QGILGTLDDAVPHEADNWLGTNRKGKRRFDRLDGLVESSAHSLVSVNQCTCDLLASADFCVDVDGVGSTKFESFRSHQDGDWRPVNESGIRAHDRSRSARKWRDGH